MRKVYHKDIWRSIKKSKMRFLSIAIITALGVTVLTGIYAACQDMYRSADLFYDEQHLFDIRIQSTLGLTEDDVQVLSAVTGVRRAEGGYIETVATPVGDSLQKAEMTVLSQNGLNLPLVQQGTLPARPGEIAVTQAYLDAAGKTVGDTLTITEDLDEDAADDEGAETPAPADSAPKADTEEDETLDTEVDWDADVDIEDEAGRPTFPRTTYTITAVVLDPMDISNTTTAFRSSSTPAYSFFITAADADTDVFTAVYLTLDGLREMNCYSDEYEAAVQTAVDRIEDEIQQQREQARYDAVMAEALEKLTDAEQTMDEKFTEADDLFANAWAELEDAKQELLDGEAELTAEEKDALRKLAAARAELEDGKAQLRSGEDALAAGVASLADGKAALEENAQKLRDGKAQLEAQRALAEKQFALAEEQLDAQQAALDQTMAQLAPGVDGLKALFGDVWPEEAWNALVGAAAAETAAQLAANPGAQPDPAGIAATTAAQQADLGTAIAATGNPVLSAVTWDSVQTALGLGMVTGSQQVLTAGRTAFEEQRAAAIQQMDEAAAEIASGESQLQEGQTQLNIGMRELEKARQQLDEGWKELAGGEAELNAEEAKALQEIADAWRELADGKEELADGEAALTENRQEYQDKKAEAEEKLADAYAELADIDMAEWYVQDRTALDSYSSIKSDLSSIEAVGNAFPVVFLAVAILISLTTMTRMVEEERGLIGTYKAMGYGGGAIYGKYLLYAFSACLLGGIVGDLIGFILLPKFLIYILRVLYTLPNVYLGFDVLYGVGGVLLFMVGIVGATALACRRELRRMPAALIRPKAPRAGSRIFLERLPFLWNRLKFLNKVTARNLFRYKKRLFMTVLGIMGCTALVLAGFAIRDSVTDMMPKQYENTYQYDLMAVTDAAGHAGWLADVAGDECLGEYLSLQIGSIKLLGADGRTETAQLMVVPSGASLGGYIGTRDTDGRPVQLDSSGIFVTQNAAELLALQPGGTVTLQNLQLERRDVPITQVVQNYLGNLVYITQDLYQKLYGDYAPNGILAHLTPACPDQPAYAKSLLRDERVLSATSTEAVKADFATNFTLINAVVYLLIVLAAGLAFVVLLTLSNTNISERVRELATTKVLGFYDNEVHAYINKETLILTGLGILLGLPVGRFISGLLTAALKMPSMYFAVCVVPTSYLIAAALSFSFALAVNLMTNRTLNRIDMVEALKSVE